MDAATFARQVEKGFDSGPGAQAALTPGANLVHLLTQESEHPEYRYLRLERICGGAFTTTGVPAEFAQGGLSNPAGSGALLIVPSVVIINRSATTNHNYTVRIGPNVTFDAAIPGVLCDTRYGPTNTIRATGLQVSHSDAAPALANIVGRAAVLLGQSFELPGPWVISPGFALLITQATAAVECAGSVRWWERAAEAGELQGSGV